MWDKILRHKWFASTGIYGLEISYAQDRSVQYHCLHLEQNKEQLTLVASQSVKQEELQDFFTEDFPVVLVLNGRSLLHKMGRNVAPEDNFKQLLPHVDPSDFYHQQFSLNEEKSDLVVIRKDQLDLQLKELENTGLKIAQVYLGPYVLNAVLPLLEESEWLYFREQRFRIDEGKITGVSPYTAQHKEYQLGGDVLGESGLICYAGIISYITEAEMACEIPSVSARDESMKHQRFFQLAYKVVLGFFLVLMLANFFGFTHYDDTKRALDTKMRLNRTEMKRLEDLRTTVEDLKRFTSKREISEQSRLSFYADQIALYMPADIKLKRMELHPEVKKKGRRKVRVFEKKRIRIEGQSLSGSSFDLWNSIIREKPWVNSIKVVYYKQERTSQTASFLMEINLQ